MGALAAVAGITAGAFSFLLPEWHRVRHDPALAEDVRIGEGMALVWSLAVTSAIASKTSNAAFSHWAATSVGLLAIYEWAIHEARGKRKPTDDDDCGCGGSLTNG